jgi:hypothetical protein
LVGTGPEKILKSAPILAIFWQTSEKNYFSKIPLPKRRAFHFYFNFATKIGGFNGLWKIIRCVGQCQQRGLEKI